MMYYDIGEEWWVRIPNGVTWPQPLMKVRVEAMSDVTVEISREGLTYPQRWCKSDLVFVEQVS